MFVGLFCWVVLLWSFFWVTPTLPYQFYGAGWCSSLFSFGWAVAMLFLVVESEHRNKIPRKFWFVLENPFFETNDPKGQLGLFAGILISFVVAVFVGIISFPT